MEKPSGFNGAEDKDQASVLLCSDSQHASVKPPPSMQSQNEEDGWQGCWEDSNSLFILLCTHIYPL